MESIRWENTRWLLRCGILVGPFYLAVGLIQAFVRDGFDLGRHPLSVLANGPGGWVQTANFLLSGLMVVAAAVGIGRVLRPQSRISGWLLACFGVSMLAAAMFPADPVDGFPVGTPEGLPTTVSTVGMIHFASGGIGFLALAVSCITVAVAMSRRGESWMARLSFVCGLSVLAGFFAPALLPASGPVAGIWFSVVIGWTWLALTSAFLSHAVPS
jgi:hypothetical protein